MEFTGLVAMQVASRSIRSSTLPLPKGMIILKDDELAKKLRLLKAFGVNRSHGEKIPGDYGVIELGYNYRMKVHAQLVLNR